MATHEVAQSVPDTSPDGRLMYYEHQVQPNSEYRGPLETVGVESVRRMLLELAQYANIFSPYDFPLPPAGLPGHLHDAYSRDEAAADLLAIGMGYVRACMNNERRGMHNRWSAAREFIQKLEEQVEARIVQRLIDEQIERDRQSDRAADASKVYFIGSESGPIKIGMARDPNSRLRGLQTSHHERLELLAICDGGQEQERLFHKRFADRRLQGEWFERCPEILAEIEQLGGISNATP